MSGPAKACIPGIAATVIAMTLLAACAANPDKEHESLRDILEPYPE